MSFTRDLIARLRAQLGEARPLAPAPIPIQIAPPPRRIFPVKHTRSAYAKEAAACTTALVGIGRVGTRYATAVLLQFQAELAVAHDAVAAVLPEDWPTQHGLLALRSQVTSHHEFLLRPDLGRRLDPASLRRLQREAQRDVDLQPILADGLSAVACEGSGLALLAALTRECEARGWRVGTPMTARFARVWLQDEIGEAVNAKVAVIILGERPGLGTGDGLSAYMVYKPKLGKTDGDRNMISNIHPRGIPPDRAAKHLALLAGAMIEQRTSGVALNLSALTAELGADAYRAPAPRKQLVEVRRDP